MTADRRPAPGRRPPGIGAISLLAGGVVLVPGILLYVVLRAVGLGIGAAGLLGLLLMIVCMCAYPVILRRTGWVGPPRQRPAAGSPAPPSEGTRPEAQP
jgi:hypothetical protein